MTHNSHDQIFWKSFFIIFFLLLFSGVFYFLHLFNRLHSSISTFDFIILSLATFRLIRLVTYDDITDFIRDYLAKFSSGPRKILWHLLDCPWCSGIWMALVVMFLYFVSPFTWYLLLLLAISGVGSFIQIVIWKIGRE